MRTYSNALVSLFARADLEPAVATYLDGLRRDLHRRVICLDHPLHIDLRAPPQIRALDGADRRFVHAMLEAALVLEPDRAPTRKIAVGRLLQALKRLQRRHQPREDTAAEIRRWIERGVAQRPVRGSRTPRLRLVYSASDRGAGLG